MSRTLHRDSGRIRPGRITDPREAQLAWTLCVALAVLVAAIYHFGSPRNFFAENRILATPEAVRTGSPLISPQNMDNRFPASTITKKN